MFTSLRREEGATAVEFALVAPVLFMIVFAIIGFGVAFLQLQTARSAVREGARQAAIMKSDGTRFSSGQVAATTANSSAGLISSGEVQVSSCSGPSGESTVSYNTASANGGEGIVVSIPFVPSISMNTIVSAHFVCEG